MATTAAAAAVAGVFGDLPGIVAIAIERANLRLQLAAAGGGDDDAADAGDAG